MVNLALWLQPHALTFSIAGHARVLPKIAWTWWVLIGSLVTCAVGYSASPVVPGSRSHREGGVRVNRWFCVGIVCVAMDGVPAEPGFRRSMSS